MIIKARHHFFYYPFFKFYAGWSIHRHFGHVEINGEFKDRNLPVLLLANHFSWWDGIMALYLNVSLLKRKFHFMMMEEQLTKFTHPNLIGGYSVRKGSRSAIESIEYTVELLNDRANLVLVFPQGKIESAYTFPLNFEGGIKHIIKRSGALQIIFMANLVDYFSDRKPGLFIYISEFVGDKFDTGSIQDAYNHFYKECISANALKSTH
ncbi:MAG: lysophospholipid acyltransferase family protein [Mariniphaga sp.]